MSLARIFVLTSILAALSAPGVIFLSAIIYNPLLDSPLCGG